MVLCCLGQASKFNYGSAGPSTFGAMATDWLIRTSGANCTGITDGGPGILQGLVSGDLQLLFGGIAAATPRLQTGTAKVIEVTSAQRMTRLPDVPAIDETIAASTHTGQGEIMNEVIDPSVMDESDPLLNDPALDMYAPALIARYSAGQHGQHLPRFPGRAALLRAG